METSIVHSRCIDYSYFCSLWLQSLSGFTAARTEQGPVRRMHSTRQNRLLHTHHGIRKARSRRGEVAAHEVASLVQAKLILIQSGQHPLSPCMAS